MAVLEPFANLVTSIRLWVDLLTDRRQVDTDSDLTTILNDYKRFEGQETPAKNVPSVETNEQEVEDDSRMSISTCDASHSTTSQDISRDVTPDELEVEVFVQQTSSVVRKRLNLMGMKREEIWSLVVDSFKL